MWKKLCLKLNIALLRCEVTLSNHKNNNKKASLILLSPLSLPPSSSSPSLLFWPFLISPQPSHSFSLCWPCPVKQGTCCGVVTRNCGQLHGRFCRPFFCSGVQSASICHCLTTVPPGEMGLILQSISRRAAFVLSPAPMGPICFTAPSLSLHFDASHFLSHLFARGSLSLSGCVTPFVSFCSPRFLFYPMRLYFVCHILFISPVSPVSLPDTDSLRYWVSACHISPPGPPSLGDLCDIVGQTLSLAIMGHKKETEL